MSLLLRIYSALLFISIGTLQAQAPIEPAAILAAGTQYLESIYHEDQDSLAPLFDGKHYLRNQLITDGHAFYPGEDPIMGSIQIENYAISGIRLCYDVHQDLLVFVPEKIWVGEIIMNPELVDRFSLGAYEFVNMQVFPPMANEGRFPKPGYYEVLYAGKTQAYAKRIKSFLENLDNPFNQGKYWQKDAFYLVSKGRTYPLRTQKDLVKGLNDTSGSLRSYIRKENFRFKRASSLELARLLAYYDSL